MNKNEKLPLRACVKFLTLLPLQTRMWTTVDCHSSYLTFNFLSRELTILPNYLLRALLRALYGFPWAGVPKINER
jgi:hypothetical protein